MLARATRGEGVEWQPDQLVQITEVGNCTNPGKGVPGAGTGVCIRGRGLGDDE